MANTYKALSTVTVGAGGTSAITFSNIPQTYTDLVIHISGRDSRALYVDDYGIQLNGSTSTFSYRTFIGDGSGTSSASSSFSVTGVWNGGNATSSTFGNAMIYIPNYTSNKVKSISGSSVNETNSTTAQQWLSTTVWNTAAPITSITIVGNDTPTTIQPNSTATLYGVFNADVSGVPSAPTIGTATAVSPTSATVDFTSVSNAASYTATSTPGSITATAATSPITVTGLTSETAYTFKVKANNPFGSSAESAASNSVTPSAAYFESIATVTTTSSQSSAVFTNIPQTYKHLQIRILSRGTKTANTDGQYMRYNDSTSGYVFGGGRFMGTNNGSGTLTESPWIGVSTAGVTIGQLVQANATSQVRNATVIDIPNYASTNNYKISKAIDGFNSNGTAGTYVGMFSGMWQNTSAITKIEVFPGAPSSYPANCVIALYGIRG